MGNQLLIAAGGGGDAIAAAMLAGSADSRSTHVATFSWDRLMVDPLPGPRGPEWFTGLRSIGSHNFQVSSESSVHAPAGSLLPRLAAELPVTLYLLDADRGVVGLRDQLLELIDIVRPERVAIVDAGGDVLAVGDEPQLRSPLADALVLAATDELPAEVVLLVTALGLDGELPERRLLQRCAELGATNVGKLLPKNIEHYRSVFEWHPSEATGLLWAAALGARGRVEIRGDGLVVGLTDHSAEVHELKHAQVMGLSRLAHALLHTRSLAEAEAATVAVTGSSEIEYERRRANSGATNLRQDIDTAKDLDRLRYYAMRATDRGVDYLTLRRIGEVLGLPMAALAPIRELLRRRGPLPYFPPLWPVQGDLLGPERPI